MSFGLHYSHNKNPPNTHITYSMNALTTTASQNKVNNKVATAAQTKQNWIFVCQLNSGIYVVGQATNPSRRICSINSGYNRAVPEPLSIFRVVGIKKQTEERNLMSVTKQLCDRFGSDRVLAL